MRNRFILTLTIILLSGLLMLYSQARPAMSAATVYVDAVNGNDTTGTGSSSQPWRTITHALTHVSAGDTIMVRPGIYNAALGESFPINLPPGVRLIGSGRDTTVIAGESTIPILYIGSKTTDILSDTLVSDLALRDGSLGLKLFSSQGHIASPTIANVRAYQNVTGIDMTTGDFNENGATIAATITNTEVISNVVYGIHINSVGYLSPSSIAPVIANSTVRGNGHHGLYVEAVDPSSNGTSASPRVVNTRISDNHGHGVCVMGHYQGWANPQIERSWIQNNGGYGLYWIQGTSGGNINATVTNTVIMRNQSGGIYLGNGGSGNDAIRVVNATLVENAAYGIYWESGSGRVQPTVVNSIFWDSSADELYATSTAWTPNEIRFSDIKDDDLAGQAGNFSQDPLLRDDYHLSACSPALDAGTSIGAPDDDIDGDPRPYGSAPDVGADEYAASCLLRSLKQVSAGQAQIGSLLAYTITLTNTTVLTPIDALVTDTLPVALEYQADSLVFSQGTARYSSGGITWTDTISPSGVVTISLQGRVVAGSTTIYNSVVANAGDLGFYRNPVVGTYIEPARCYLPTVFRDYCSGPIRDDFSSPASGWPSTTTPSWSYGYLNGEYRFLSQQGKVFGAVTRGDKTNRIVDFEADMRQASTVTGSMGLLLFLNDDWSHFKTFEVYPATQEYKLFDYTNGSWYLQSSGSSNAIRPGQSVNHLQITWNHEEFGYDVYDLRINGMRVDSFWWSKSAPALRIGFMATASAPGFDARFDNYKLVPEGCPENSQISTQAREPLDASFETTRGIEWNKP